MKKIKGVFASAFVERGSFYFPEPITGLALLKLKPGLSSESKERVSQMATAKASIQISTLPS